VGAAWRIGDDTVLRGAYGLFYDRIFNIMFSGQTNNVPFAVASSAALTPYRFGQVPPVNPSTPSITGVDPSLHNPSMHRFNAAVERQLFGRVSVSAAYVGSRGRDLIRLLEPNGSGAVPQALRPDPRFSDQILLSNYSSSNYDALQIYSRWPSHAGVDLTVAYTYSRSKDDFSSDREFSRYPSLINLGADPNVAGVQGGGTQFVARPPSADYGFSSFDTPHNLSISYLVDLPFGSGRRWLSDANPVARALAGGWSVGGVMLFRSGQPINVTLGRDINDDGDAANDRPGLLTGSASDLYAAGGNRTQYLITQAEALARLGVPSNVTDPSTALPRNALRGPGLAVVDLSIVKRIGLGQRTSVALEVNAFNLFNRVQFANPIAALSNPRFGQIISTRSDYLPRQIQFGAKVTF
jgi:hypothetical protein